MLDYTIWLKDNDPAGTYMWSLATDEAKERTVEKSSRAMFAPLLRDGVRHAFELLKKSHPTISDADQTREPMKILGRNGKPDLLDTVLTKPDFGTRTFTESFVLLGQNAESGDYYVGGYREWAALTSEIVNWFNSHRGKFRIVTSHDPGWYWLGTVKASVEPERYRAIITVAAEVEPYKYERYASNETWIWDDFSFIDGIIREYGVIELSADAAVELNVPMRTVEVIPLFRRVGTNDTRFTAYNFAILSLVAVVANAAENENYTSTVAGNIETAWGNAKTAYQTISGEYYDIPEIEGNFSRIDAIVADFSDDVENKAYHEAGYDLRELSSALAEIVSVIFAGQVIASVDNGVTWHSVGYDELKQNDNVMLEGSETLEERKILLKGVCDVEVSIRGRSL